MWVRLLTRVREVEGDEPDGLFGALHGARCAGARLVRTPAGMSLAAGELSDEEYGAFREGYLRCHAPLLVALLTASV